MASLALAAACSFVLACASSAAGTPPIRIKLIAFNDLHGHIEPPQMTVQVDGSTRVPAGGISRFATLIKSLRAQNRNNAVVSAGDMVGASPLVSGLFLDEPTIEAMNLISVDFNAVGNHEFDKGVAELRRKQVGGCGSEDVPVSSIAPMKSSIRPCQAGHRFAGAKFRFLSANVVEEKTGATLFPPYGIKSFEGVKVAFVGIVLRGTPFVTTPANVRGLSFRDEAETVNALVPELRKQGVKLIVVLIHQGGMVTDTSDSGQCSGLTGDIVPILKRLDHAVSVVVSGHTHQDYACEYDGFLLTSAGSYGRLVTDIDLEVDRTSGALLRKTARNRVVASEAYADVRRPPAYPLLEEDAAVERLVRQYAALVKPLAERTVGRITAPLTQIQNDAGESSLGEVIADAHLAATREAGAQIAFTNSGGIRAPLEHFKDGSVSYARLFGSQPFGNRLITLSLTGSQLKELLEQQFRSGRRRPQILQVSTGFHYSYDERRSRGDRVIAARMALNGAAIDPRAKFRVTVNDFLSGGGDGFAVLREAGERTSGILDVDALEAYFGANSPIGPGKMDRIERLP